MPFQLLKPPKMFDICIVGSRAVGGMAAKVLAEAGFKIALLEAGPDFDPANPSQRTQLSGPREWPRWAAGSSRPIGDFDMAYGGWEIEGEPYTKKTDLNMTGFVLTW